MNTTDSIASRIAATFPDFEVAARTTDGGSGDFRWCLECRLGMLQEGSLDAFRVWQQHSAYNGVDEDTYNKRTYQCVLPDGAKRESIAEFCAAIYERRAELTQGYTAEWDNGSYKGRFVDSDEGYLTPVSDAERFWKDFEDEAESAIDCVQVIDLALNGIYLDYIWGQREDILEALRPAQWGDAAAVENAIRETYEEETEYFCIGYREAATRLVDDLRDAEEED